ncbi:MAG TPA: 4a-hydroxytetrahydrobiopterin dehydratase [Candidatus Nanopelagicales bacterium]
MVDAHHLSPLEAQAALAGLPGWQRDGEVITATYAMESFLTGIELVRLAGMSAEAANHHPDIDVRSRQVTFRLTTHEGGGLTMRDVNLARRIQAHAMALGWVSP